VAQVPFAKNDDMVKASRRIEPISRSACPFCHGERGWPVTNAHGAKPPGENFAIVAEDVAWCPFPSHRVSLPGSLFGGRVCRHAEP
jgi:hypothetical protein